MKFTGKNFYKQVAEYIGEQVGYFGEYVVRLRLTLHTPDVDVVNEKQDVLSLNCYEPKNKWQFLNPWWEGEDEVELVGYINVNEVEVPAQKEG